MFEENKPKLRLSNDATGEGRLEMWYNNEWFVVCYQGDEDDDHSWNDQAATVACRQLGYDGGIATIYESLSINNDNPVGQKANDVRCGNGMFSFSAYPRKCRVLNF